MVPFLKSESITFAYRMMMNSRTMLAGFALLAGGACASAQGLGRPAAQGAHLAASPAAEVLTASASDSLLLSARAADPVQHTADTDDRLNRAEAHFDTGRQYYFQDKIPAARKEFDAAIDILLNAPESAPDHRRIERKLDELCDTIYRFDLENLGAGETQEAVVYDKAPIDEITHMTFPVDSKLAPRVRSELNQTTSGIPLELTEPVLNYIQYFSSERGRNTLLAGFRRSGKYRPLIQRILAEEGVPQELIYLAQAESGFLPRALSNKSAMGMWQFMAGTGAMYQLTRTSAYDERLDPEKATRAAARHLKDLYTRYGDWYLAIAAYNCGAGLIDRAVERTGYADYWELLKRHALPRETANYVPVILAMTIIAKNPQDYGVQAVDLDPPIQYDTIEVSAPTNINLIADATMQPVSVLRDLNPALLKPIVPGGFEIHVPQGSAEIAQSALESVPAQNRMAWRLHHVTTGDTLASIAKTYHLSADQIASVNPASDSIESGDVLLIPAVYHEPPAVRSRSSRSKAHTVTVAAHSTSKYGRSTHVAAARHVPAQVLHRKAAVRTASLQH